MIGDGVIAESKISFKITWYNPGRGLQPTWNQNKQEILIHESDIYPDLLYTEANGIATYYTYTNIDRLLHLIKQIDAKIDEKLTISEGFRQLGSTTNIQKASPTNIHAPELTTIQNGNQLAQPNINRGGVPATINRGGVPATINRGGVLATISNTPEVPVNQNDITNADQQITSPTQSGASGAYTVIVHGDQLTFLDAQINGATIRIRHKVSKNLFRKINDEIIDNTKKIWLEVITNAGTRKFNMEEFEVTEDGINLLVEILPTVDIVLKPGESAVSPKSEETVSDEDRIQEFARIRRYGREEARYLKLKTEAEKAREAAAKIKTVKQ